MERPTVSQYRLARENETQQTETIRQAIQPPPGEYFNGVAEPTHIEIAFSKMMQTIAGMSQILSGHLHE